MAVQPNRLLRYFQHISIIEKLELQLRSLSINTENNCDVRFCTIWHSGNKSGHATIPGKKSTLLIKHDPELQNVTDMAQSCEMSQIWPRVAKCHIYVCVKFGLKDLIFCNSESWPPLGLILGVAHSQKRMGKYNIYATFKAPRFVLWLVFPNVFEWGLWLNIV